MECFKYLTHPTTNTHAVCILIWIMHLFAFFSTTQWVLANFGSCSKAHMDAHTENVTSVKCAYLLLNGRKKKPCMKRLCEFINAT